MPLGGSAGTPGFSVQQALPMWASPASASQAVSSVVTVTLQFVT